MKITKKTKKKIQKYKKKKEQASHSLFLSRFLITLLKTHISIRSKSYIEIALMFRVTRRFSTMTCFLLLY